MYVFDKDASFIMFVGLTVVYGHYTNEGGATELAAPNKKQRPMLKSVGRMMNTS